MNKRGAKRNQRGATIVEFALISPALILIGLGLVQVGLVFHAKSALSFALQEAARSGASGHASPESIQQGFLRGLIPYTGGGLNAGDLAAALASATTEFARGTGEGWIRMQQLSPTPQSFTDWQENTVDASGNAVVQIPNANLPVLRCTRAPNSGTSGYRSSTACTGSGEPVGANSEQTLADANLLKLQLTYGVRLGIPFINRIVGKALAMAAGCQAPAAQKAGPLNLGTPAGGGADPSACAAYNAVDASGNPDPRIPVSLAITVRMQSPARSANSQGWLRVAARSRDANSSGVRLGNGTVDDASQFAPIPVAQLNPNGVTLSADTQNRTGVGSTEIGNPNQTETLGDPGPPITCTGN
ncbi:MAG TPA: TadE family protein [Steroidobacteraceae bacterium]